MNTVLYAMGFTVGLSAMFLYWMQELLPSPHLRGTSRSRGLGPTMADQLLRKYADPALFGAAEDVRLEPQRFLQQATEAEAEWFAAGYDNTDLGAPSRRSFFLADWRNNPEAQRTYDVGRLAGIFDKLSGGDEELALTILHAGPSSKRSLKPFFPGNSLQFFEKAAKRATNEQRLLFQLIPVVLAVLLVILGELLANYHANGGPLALGIGLLVGFVMGFVTTGSVILLHSWMSRNIFRFRMWVERAGSPS